MQGLEEEEAVEEVEEEEEEEEEEGEEEEGEEKMKGNTEDMVRKRAIVKDEGEEEVEKVAEK